MKTHPQVEDNKIDKVIKQKGMSTYYEYDVIVYTTQLDILTYNKIINTVTLHM